MAQKLESYARNGMMKGIFTNKHSEEFRQTKNKINALKDINESKNKIVPSQKSNNKVL